MREEFKIREIMENMMEAGKARKKAPNPVARYQADKASQLLKLVKQKGAVNNEKEYNRIRLAFEQNWDKQHPVKPTQSW